MNKVLTMLKLGIGLLFALLASIGWAIQTEQPFTTVFRYDIVGRLLGTISPDPDAGGQLRYLAVRNTYNDRGLLVRAEQGELFHWMDETVEPKFWGDYTTFQIHLTREFDYNNYGYVIKESVLGADLAIESVTQFSYDFKGRVYCKAVRMNKNIYGSLPSDPCMQSTQGSDGPDRISRYSYDGLDNITTEERAVGTTLVQAYKTATYTGRKPLSLTDANGNRTEFQYDKY